MAEKKIVWPAHVMERIHRFVAEAPPLNPDQQATIRWACTTPASEALPPAPRAKPRPAQQPNTENETTMGDKNEPVSLDELQGTGPVDLFKHIDKQYRAASAAMADGDMAAWIEHAGRGAELFEEAARLNGWRDS